MTFRKHCHLIQASTYQKWLIKKSYSGRARKCKTLAAVFQQYLHLLCEIRRVLSSCLSSRRYSASAHLFISAWWLSIAVIRQRQSSTWKRTSAPFTEQKTFSSNSIQLGYTRTGSTSGSGIERTDCQCEQNCRRHWIRPQPTSADEWSLDWKGPSVGRIDTVGKPLQFY